MIRRARPSGALRHPALLPPVAGQEHHDPIRLGELVGAQNERLGLVDRHVSDSILAGGSDVIEKQRAEPEER